MMSILIKGMEMPTTCAKCKMYVEDIYCCHLLHREIENPWADDGVELDCPLVEIPPHGRLIDADAMERKLCYGCDACNGDTAACVEYGLIATAPTIIQAEPPKEET